MAEKKDLDKEIEIIEGDPSALSGETAKKAAGDTGADMSLPNAQRVMAKVILHGEGHLTEEEKQSLEIARQMREQYISEMFASPTAAITDNIKDATEAYRAFDEEIHNLLTGFLAKCLNENTVPADMLQRIRRGYNDSQSGEQQSWMAKHLYDAVKDIAANKDMPDKAQNAAKAWLAVMEVPVILEIINRRASELDAVQKTLDAEKTAVPRDRKHGLFTVKAPITEIKQGIKQARSNAGQSLGLVMMGSKTGKRASKELSWEYSMNDCLQALYYAQEALNNGRKYRVPEADITLEAVTNIISELEQRGKTFKSIDNAGRFRALVKSLKNNIGHHER